jgi:hypothetical protein
MHVGTHALLWISASISNTSALPTSEKQRCVWRLQPRLSIPSQSCLAGETHVNRRASASFPSSSLGTRRRALKDRQERSKRAFGWRKIVTSGPNARSVLKRLSQAGQARVRATADSHEQAERAIPGDTGVRGRAMAGASMHPRLVAVVRFRRIRYECSLCRQCASICSSVLPFVSGTRK